MSTPVILLAFANDKSQPDRFLDELKAEKEGILAHLDEIPHLCEVEIVEDTNIDRLMDAFQRIGNRLAIFHFAGHAGSFHLCLESAEGNQELAHGSGLARFLGLQPNLQLVFLNGCSTQKQADLLLAEGVPAVIATSEQIKDGVARDLSTNFFHSLSKGDRLFTAFQEAVASVQIRHGERHRNLFFEDTKVSSGRFPWDLYVRPGAERIHDWNLPTAAHDPLFGLPSLDEIYPPEPYRYLEWYREEDARIFFGRSFQIRSLYEKIRVKPQQKALEAQAKAKGWEGSTALQDPPVIHLYGRSGVGKSSLMAAGLSPRLKKDHQIQYLRRSQDAGLLGTLQAGLNATKPQDIYQAWQAIEAKHKQPLIVFLDQGEEVFTRPKAGTTPKREWIEFLAILKMMFFDGQTSLKGKLVLSYRKEYLAEIEEAFKVAALPWQKVFLQRLKRDDVIDAIEGVSREQGCRETYKLSIERREDEEKSLAKQIADDLLQDPESPVAPMLQILLSKMWRKAKVEHPEQIQFTHDLYRYFQANGLGMEDFLHQQLKSLEAEEPELVRSGLVLDLLSYHTTALGTATKRKFADLQEIFPVMEKTFKNLLIKLKKRYLLIDPNQDQTTRLAHDTLAPLVQRRSDESNAPGQQSVRVLRNQLVLNRESIRPRPLDEEDLELIKQGRKGRRKPSSGELHLYLCSKVLNFPTVSERERVQALQAWGLKEDALSEQALRQAFHNSFFHQQSSKELEILALSFSPNGQWLLLAYGEHDAVICDLEGKVLFPLAQSVGTIQMRWNKAGDQVLLLQETGILSLWDLNQKAVTGIELTPKIEAQQGRGRYASKGGGGKGGRQKSRFLLHDFAFTADETGILVFHPEAGPQLYDHTGKLQQQYEKKFESIAFALLIPKHKLQFVVLENGSAMQAHIELERYDDLEFAFEDDIRDGYWAQDKNEIILLTRKNLWRLVQNHEPQVKAIMAIEKARIVAPTLGTDEYLLASGEGDCQLVHTVSKVNLAFRAADLELVEEIQMSPDGKKIAALNQGQLILWDLQINYLDLQKRLERSPIDIRYQAEAGHLLLGTANQVALYQNLDDPQPQYWFAANRQRIHSVAISPDGSHLVYGDEAGNIELISLVGERQTQSIKGVYIEELLKFSTEFNYRPDSIKADEFPGLPFDPTLVAQAEDPMKIMREKIPGHWGAVHSLAFLADGKHFVSAGQDWSIKVWNLKGEKRYETAGMQSLPNLNALRGEDVTQFQQQIQVQSDPFAAPNMSLDHLIVGVGHSEPVRELIVRPGREQVLAIDERRQIQLFDYQTKKLHKFSPKARKAAFSPSGERLYLLDIDRLSAYELADSEEDLKLWDINLPIKDAQSISISPSGERLALGNRTGQILIYNMDGQWQSEIQTAIKSSVRTICWLNDDLIAVGQEDRRLRMISLDTPAILSKLQATEQSVVPGLIPEGQESQKRGGRGSGSVRSR